MVKNMEKKETLRQYLTYHKDFDEINQIFINLDSQMKYLHQKGYCILDLNSDTILLESDKANSNIDQNTFMFSSIIRSTNRDQDFSNNIVDLTKLAIGAFISVENGFCDYSQLSTNYIKRYFGEIAFYLPNKEYFANIIVDNKMSYYSDYVQAKSDKNRNNTIQKTKATEYGKMYSGEEESAFIQLVFYPVIIISIITIIAVISKLFN